jgi:hypothetical protein
MDLMRSLPPEFKNFDDNPSFFKVEPTCGYASDLLSCVMSGAARESVFGYIAGTHQYHRCCHFA